MNLHKGRAAYTVVYTMGLSTDISAVKTDGEEPHMERGTGK